MKKEEEFINEYLKKENKASIGKWTETLNNEECEKLNKKAKSYYHSIVSAIDFGRGVGFFDDEEIKEYAPIKIEEIVKRTLFQIKKYENPTCGDVIKRILKDNVIYLCYTSDDEKYEDSKIRYSRIFVVANTNEGMKIITYFLFKDGILDQPDDYEPNHITDLGTLVEKRKFQAPEEENSLADYNAE
jgi:hypothetical protein